MPTEICKKCGQKVSYSKIDKFEDVHRCRQPFRDKIQTKPIKNAETKKPVDAQPSERDIEKSEQNAKEAKIRDKS